MGKRFFNSWLVRRSVSIETRSQSGGRECSAKRSCHYEPIVKDIADAIVRLTLVVTLCIVGCDFTDGLKKFSPDELVKTQKECKVTLSAFTNEMHAVSETLTTLKHQVNGCVSVFSNGCIKVLNIADATSRVPPAQDTESPSAEGAQLVAPQKAGRQIGVER